MSLSPLEDMDPRQRRRLIGNAALRTSAIIALLLGLYAVLPVAGRSDAPAIVELLVGLCAFVALLSLEVRVILRADYPWLRAAEALALALAVLIIVFAFTYLSLSRSNQASFSEPLDHVGAMYFTVTILSTVGFGDIAAKTDLARITVTLPDTDGHRSRRRSRPSNRLRGTGRRSPERTSWNCRRVAMEIG